MLARMRRLMLLRTWEPSVFLSSTYTQVPFLGPWRSSSLVSEAAMSGWLADVVSVILCPRPPHG